MQMPEPRWFTYKLTDSAGDVRAFEHEVAVLLPYRRYLRDGQPRQVPGSPSVVVVGMEERHGTELSVRRVSYESTPSAETTAEILGELAEAWVFMTLEMTNSVDPRWDP